MFIVFKDLESDANQEKLSWSYVPKKHSVLQLSREFRFTVSKWKYFDNHKFFDSHKFSAQRHFAKKFQMCMYLSYCFEPPICCTVLNHLSMEHLL